MTTPAITSFEGEHEFLSNFWPCKIKYKGLVYPSTEAAYQAAKFVPSIRPSFQNLTPKAAKRKAKRLLVHQLPAVLPGWQKRKVFVMSVMIIKKFKHGSRLAQKLIDTGDAELVEGNYWHDYFWGVCNGKGLNMLGKLLMARRAKLLKRMNRNE